jgi:chaperone required for assembly of F1-ATPase
MLSVAARWIAGDAGGAMGGEAHRADHFEVEWEVRAADLNDSGVQLELDLREAGVPEEVVVDLTEAQAEAEALADRIRDEADAGDTVIDRGTLAE